MYAAIIVNDLYGADVPLRNCSVTHSLFKQAHVLRLLNLLFLASRAIHTIYTIYKSVLSW